MGMVGAPCPPPMPGLAPPPMIGGAPPPPFGLKKKKKPNPVPKPRKKMTPFHWKPIKKVQKNANAKSIWNDISLDKIKIDLETEQKTTDDDKKEKESRKKNQNHGANHQTKNQRHQNVKLSLF